MKSKVIALLAVASVSSSALIAQEESGIVTLDPPTVRQSNSYSHGKLVPSNSQLLFTAGQVGVRIGAMMAMGLPIARGTPGTPPG